MYYIHVHIISLYYIHAIQVVVLALLPDMPAAATGAIKINDEITEVGLREGDWGRVEEKTELCSE
jgi:C-terminal processing protease CtpA/Prc